MEPAQKTKLNQTKYANQDGDDLSLAGTEAGQIFNTDCLSAMPAPSQVQITREQRTWQDYRLFRDEFEDLFNRQLGQMDKQRVLKVASEVLEQQRETSDSIEQILDKTLSTIRILDTGFL